MLTRLGFVLLIAVFFATAPECVFAQNARGSNAVQAKPGTYQFLQKRDSKSQKAEVFTAQTLTSIEANRHATEVVYLQLSPRTRVMILPYSTINAPTFKPITDSYVWDDDQ